MKGDIKRLKEAITLSMEAGIPLLIRGRPGIGKSAIVRQAAEAAADKAGRRFIEWNAQPKAEKENLLTDAETRKKTYIYADVRLSQYDSTDLKGLPDFGRDNATLTWRPMLLFAVMSKTESAGMLFLDELTNAAPSVQMAAYQLMNERAIGETTLADGVAILAAGNDAEDNCHILEMPLPLRDRLMEFQLEADADAWIRWAAENGTHPTVIAYVAWKKADILHIADDGHKPTTPRGWARVSKLRKHGADAVLAAETSVHPATAKTYAAFCKLEDKISVEEILAAPEKAAKLEAQLKYILLAALPSYWGGVKAGKAKIAGKKATQKEAVDAMTSLYLAIEPEFFAMSAMMMLADAAFSKAFFSAENRKYAELAKRHGAFF